MNFDTTPSIELVCRKCGKVAKAVLKARRPQILDLHICPGCETFYVIDDMQSGNLRKPDRREIKKLMAKSLGSA